MTTYQVVGEAALITQTGPLGTAKVLLYKGALVGDGATQEEIDHNLASGLIAEVGGEVTGGLNADGTPDALAGQTVTVTDTPSTDTTAAPDAKAPKAEWVDYAVSRGMDRAEADKATKDDLRAALAA